MSNPQVVGPGVPDDDRPAWWCGFCQHPYHVEGVVPPAEITCLRHPHVYLTYLRKSEKHLLTVRYDRNKIVPNREV